MDEPNKIPVQPDPAEIESLYRRLDQEAEASGYHLNPDVEFTKDCALYVNERFKAVKQKARSIPERRPKRGVMKKEAGSEQQMESPGALPMRLPVPIWRCKVCGYLCGRESPPEKCPICKVSKDRFERFIG
jgi:rubrerythrin